MNKKGEENLRDLWDNIKQINTHTIRVPKVKATKAKTHKRDCIKRKSLFTAKEDTKKASIKRIATPRNGRKDFQIIHLRGCITI